jgi:hypothetical protein
MTTRITQFDQAAVGVERQALRDQRLMPAASSGASSLMSAASIARLRTAVIRKLMETEPASGASRQAFTVALVKPSRGSNPNHAINSSSARL